VPPSASKDFAPLTASRAAEPCVVRKALRARVGGVKQRPDAFTKTLPITTKGRDLMGKAAASAPTITLVLYHRDGGTVVPLRPSVPVVVGREPPADVVIVDHTLSRQHARFLLEAGSLVVEDLGSTNGTRVRGQPITRAAVRPGEPVTLGSVVATAYVRAPFEPALAGLRSHDAFVAATEAEVVRARFFGEPFTVLMLHGEGSGETGHVSRWCQRVTALLRPVDTAALYSPDTLEILLPRVAGTEAGERAETFVREAARVVPLRCGVAAFLDAGATVERLLDAARDAALRATEAEPVRLAAADAGATVLAASGEPPVAESSAMRRLLEEVDRLAAAPLPVLVYGETGSGKEIVARALHERGPRRSSPLVSVNCGAIPAQLVESTLFGHVKGAFTGAERTSDGVFIAADGGTVLLDEIGELPPAAQVVLLRVLESRRVVRVGSTEEIPVDVRVIAATHRDLDAMCEAGAFRRDLLFRLEVATLRVPPLRERKDEIPALAQRFLDAAAGGSRRLSFTAGAMDLLLRHTWPGNVRELRNAVERAAVIARGDTVDVEDLPQRLRQGAEPAPTRAPDAEPGEDGDLRARMRRYEIRLIVEALRRDGGNQTHAARRLGLPLRTLVHRMKLLGIRKADYHDEEHALQR
jgi:DNA-binding NtrC family response regulator